MKYPDIQGHLLCLWRIYAVKQSHGIPGITAVRKHDSTDSSPYDPSPSTLWIGCPPHGLSEAALAPYYCFYTALSQCRMFSNEGILSHAEIMFNGSGNILSTKNLSDSIGAMLLVVRRCDVTCIVDGKKSDFAPGYNFCCPHSRFAYNRLNTRYI